MCLVQLYLIERMFRKQFLLLHQQLHVQQQVAAEMHKSDRLLCNILPESLVATVKEKRLQKPYPQHAIPILQYMPDMSVLFSDISGFTKFASEKSAEVVVQVLNKQFKAFDLLCAQFKLEKVKTIGYAMLFSHIDKLGMPTFVWRGTKVTSLIL